MTIYERSPHFDWICYGDVCCEELVTSELECCYDLGGFEVCEECSC
ncbi:MAG: hypothetical protein HY667_04285 [Chloroflexi bacterium]|nr:hypothetical protein [Chloroflexota bacterium]